MFWAVVGSLGVHVLFWIVVPFLPSGDRRNESEIQRPVELVELSPAEKERLPDFLTEDVPLPEVAPSASLPTPQNTPLTQGPGRPQVRFSPILPPFFVPPPPSEFPTYRPNFRPRTRTTIVQPSTPPSVAAATPAPSAAPSRTPSPAPAATPSPSPTESPAPNPTEGQATETPPTPPAATGGRPRYNRPNNAARPTSPQLVAARQAQAEQPELFAFNEAGTTNDELRNSDRDWFLTAVELLGEDYDPDLYDPTDEGFPLVEINAAYPEEACVQRLEGTAIVGVVVGPDGKPLEDSEPTILQSSGYGFLNEQAKQIAQSYGFDEADKRIAYRVRVSFAPDQEVCESYLNELENSQPGATPSDSG